MQSKEPDIPAPAEEEPFLILDAGSKVELWNDAARAVLGKRLAAGVPLEQLLSKRDSAAAKRQLAAALGQGRADAAGAPEPLLLLRDLGRHAQLSALQSAAGSPARALLRLPAPGASAPELQAKLTKLAEEAEQFSYLASHDLQEPVRQVGSFCSLLRDRYRGSLDEEGRTYLDYALEGTQRLQALLNDLLIYSRAGRTKLELTEVDAKAAAKRAVDQLQPEISAAAARVTVGDLPVIRTDGAQLTRVLYLLLHNSLKYRSERAPEVQIGAEREGRHWKLFVRDNGIGFKPEYRDRIFEPFKRLHGRAKYPGTGMGLAVCKRLVERLGGELGAESVEGEGSIFTFTLPID